MFMVAAHHERSSSFLRDLAMPLGREPPAHKQTLCSSQHQYFWLIFGLFGKRLIKQCSKNGSGGMHGACVMFGACFVLLVSGCSLRISIPKREHPFLFLFFLVRLGHLLPHQ